MTVLTYKSRTMDAPQMFRVMQPEGDLPAVGNSRVMLGVVVGLPPEGDIMPDEAGNVKPGTGGMSVSPTLGDLPFWRVPKRLKNRVPGARGKDVHKVYRLGSGPFAPSRVTPDLILHPDRPGHGMVEPSVLCAIAEYEAHLATTRVLWMDGES